MVPVDIYYIDDPLLSVDPDKRLDYLKKFSEVVDDPDIMERFKYLVNKQENLIGASLETGVIVINDLNAKVATVIALKNHESSKILSFDTVLLKENNVWKVDYRQTLNNLSILPFGGVINSLRAIGDVINKKLEQQMPFFENQIRTFSDELIRQLDEFRHQLEKANPTEKQ